MFVARNLIDRIIPFFALLLMNFLIIQTIKREHRKSITSLTNNQHQITIKKTKKKGSFLKRTFSISSNTEDQVNRKNLKVIFFVKF